MFDQIDFEQKFYKLVVDEVNAAFSQLKDSNKSSLRDDVNLIKEGLKMQRQIMEALHSITEEATMQVSFGLLAHQQSQSDNFQLTDINDMNLGEQNNE